MVDFFYVTCDPKHLAPPPPPPPPPPPLPQILFISFISIVTSINCNCQKSKIVTEILWGTCESEGTHTHIHTDTLTHWHTRTHSQGADCSLGEDQVQVRFIFFFRQRFFIAVQTCESSQSSRRHFLIINFVGRQSNGDSAGLITHRWTSRRRTKWTKWDKAPGNLRRIYDKLFEFWVEFQMLSFDWR